MVEQEENNQTVREAVGVFTNANALQAAMVELQENGFERWELSVLAEEETIKEKLGHIYRRVEEAEDDPNAPRTIFVSEENIGVAKGVVIGTPLYIAAVTTTAVIVASGGTLLTAILAAAAAGGTAAAIGSIF